MSLIGYGDYVSPCICSLIELLSWSAMPTVFSVLCLGVIEGSKQKGQQHPKDFPGGHPPQYYPGLARLNFGVRMGSGAFNAVWPLTSLIIKRMSDWMPVPKKPINPHQMSADFRETSVSNLERKKAISVALIRPDRIPLSLIGYGDII